MFPEAGVTASWAQMNRQRSFVSLQENVFQNTVVERKKDPDIVPLLGDIARQSRYGIRQAPRLGPRRTFRTDHRDPHLSGGPLNKYFNAFQVEIMFSYSNPSCG
jgi:hypothetical protein